MKILVAVKRVMDYKASVRIKSDGSGVETAHVNMSMNPFDEIAVEKTDNEQEDIQKATQLQADWLTKIITDNPKFWFWVHRRFKSEYPQIYKN